MKRDTEFENLYSTNIGGASWYDKLGAEAQAWLRELAEFIDGKGKEPTWSWVFARFQELFPGEAPKGAGTIASTVRRLRG